MKSSFVSIQTWDFPSIRDIYRARSANGASRKQSSCITNKADKRWKWLSVKKAEGKEDEFEHDLNSTSKVKNKWWNVIYSRSSIHCYLSLESNDRNRRQPAAGMTTEEAPTHSSPTEDSSDKEQRQLALLTDPNYGTVLSFLEQFRTVLDLPSYSFQRLEDHLLHSQERGQSDSRGEQWCNLLFMIARHHLVPPRLIDFHFLLLKRLSLAKNTQRDKFDSILTKVTSDSMRVLRS